jgi:hypothetical protein
MEESTSLSRLFAEQGLKIRIRKELRSKRKQDRPQQSGAQEPRKFESEPASSNAGSRESEVDVRGEYQQSIALYPRFDIPSSSSQQPRNNSISRAITLPRSILDTHARTNIPFPPSCASPAFSVSARPDTITPEPSLFRDRTSGLDSSQMPPDRSLPRLPSIDRSKGQQHEEDYHDDLNYPKRYQ